MAGLVTIGKPEPDQKPLVAEPHVLFSNGKRRIVYTDTFGCTAMITMLRRFDYLPEMCWIVPTLVVANCIPQASSSETSPCWYALPAPISVRPKVWEYPLEHAYKAHNKAH